MDGDENGRRGWSNETTRTVKDWMDEGKEQINGRVFLNSQVQDLLIT